MTHDDVIKWKYFPRYWPFVQGIHRSRREFTGPAQRPVTWSFDVFFDLRPNKQLSKQWWGWWFETPSWSLWRHRNVKMWPRWVSIDSQGCMCHKATAIALNYKMVNATVYKTFSTNTWRLLIHFGKCEDWFDIPSIQRKRSGRHTQSRQCRSSNRSLKFLHWALRWETSLLGIIYKLEFPVFFFCIYSKVWKPTEILSRSCVTIKSLEYVWWKHIACAIFSLFNTKSN